MKRYFIFVGECIVIFTLLLVISVLIEDGRKESTDKTVAKVEAKGIVVDSTASSDIVSMEEITVTDSEPEKEKSISHNNGIITAKEAVERKDKTQIVVFGDSIWNAGRGEDGISELVMAQKDVHIYNCAIGGTTAAVYNESTQWDSWTSNSFNGMMYITNDILSEDQLIPEEFAAGIFKEIDFNEVDYIIVAYGMNDYFCDIDIIPREYYDLNSYVGALRHGIHKIREKYPHIKFIIASPTYCNWFEGERKYNIGGYVEAARGVAEEMGVYFLDMYHAFGKHPEEKMEYLEDGVHLNREGRTLYAAGVIDFLTTQGIE